MNVLQKIILLIGMLVCLLGLVSCGNDESDTIPEDTIPEDTVPEDTIPEDTVPEDTIPEGTEVLNPITASQVTDRASLKAFTLNAKAHLEKNYEVAIEDFETEEWQKCYVYFFIYIECSTYLYVLDMDLEIVFEPDVASLKGLLTERLTRLNYSEELKKVAQADGDFVQHSWYKNATSYAVLFENEGESYILVAVYVQKEQDTEQSEEDSSE